MQCNLHALIRQVDTISITSTRLILSCVDTLCRYQFGHFRQVYKALYLSYKNTYPHLFHQPLLDQARPRWLSSQWYAYYLLSRVKERSSTWHQQKHCVRKRQKNGPRSLKLLEQHVRGYQYAYHSSHLPLLVLKAKNTLVTQISPLSVPSKVAQSCKFTWSQISIQLDLQLVFF